VKSTFTPDQIRQLQHDLLTVDQTYYRMTIVCWSFITENAKSREYILHGFLRRLGLLQRCIQNVYSIYPPERSDIPSRDECVDLAINLQSFVFNVFGCIDNLAWVWATERRLTAEAGGMLGPMDISFQKKRLRKTLPPEFRRYLDDIKNWFCYMEDFRHALAHRIPLYVPPYTAVLSNFDKHNILERDKDAAIQRRDFNEYERLDDEQIRLGRFTPAMTHSQSAGSSFMYFHPQVLADWNTVAEIADKFLAQLNSLPPA
jgi:hypothetical protein